MYEITFNQTEILLILYYNSDFKESWFYTVLVMKFSNFNNTYVFNYIKYTNIWIYFQ